MKDRMIKPKNKIKKGMIKRLITLALVATLIFSTLTPVYARPGNYGESSAFMQMITGAYSGAQASSSQGWGDLAKSMAIYTAVELADQWYYQNYYNTYGKSIISFNIGGTRIDISRGQMFRMVASVAASTVAGIASGEKGYDSGGNIMASVINNLQREFITLLITETIRDLLVRKFGMSQDLAGLISELAEKFVTDNWDTIAQVPGMQMGTYLNEGAEELKQEKTKEGQTAEGSEGATEESVQQDEEGASSEAVNNEDNLTAAGAGKVLKKLNKNGGKVPQSTDRYTQKDIKQGKKLSERALKNAKDRLKHYEAGWHPFKKARERNIAELKTEIQGLETLLGAYNKLEGMVNENPDGVSLASGDVGNGIREGLAQNKKATTDPVARAIKKGVDGAFLGVLGMVSPESADEARGQLGAKDRPVVRIKEGSERTTPWLGKDDYLTYGQGKDEQKYKIISRDGDVFRTKAVDKQGRPREYTIIRSSDGRDNIQPDQILPEDIIGNLRIDSAKGKDKNGNEVYSATDTKDLTGRKYTFIRTPDGKINSWANDVRYTDKSTYVSGEGEEVPVTVTTAARDSRSGTAEDLKGRKYTVAVTPDGPSVQPNDIAVGDVYSFSGGKGENPVMVKVTAAKQSGDKPNLTGVAAGSDGKEWVVTKTKEGMSAQPTGKKVALPIFLDKAMRGPVKSNQDKQAMRPASSRSADLMKDPNMGMGSQAIKDGIGQGIIPPSGGIPADIFSVEQKEKYSGAENLLPRPNDGAIDSVDVKVRDEASSAPPHSFKVGNANFTKISAGDNVSVGPPGEAPTKFTVKEVEKNGHLISNITAISAENGRTYKITPTGTGGYNAQLQPLRY